MSEDRRSSRLPLDVVLQPYGKRVTSVSGIMILMAALVSALSPKVWAVPCEDARAFLQAKQDVAAAQQNLEALDRGKPAGYWEEKEQRLAELGQETRNEIEEYDALSAITMWLGAVDKDVAWQRVQSLRIPPGVNTQLTGIRRLQTDIAALENDIREAEDVEASENRDRENGKPVLTAEKVRENIAKLEGEITRMMPDVPIHQAKAFADNTQYRGFRDAGGKIEELEKEIRDLENGQARFFWSEEQRAQRLGELYPQRNAAITQARETVQAKLGVLDSERRVLEDKASVASLPDKRNQKAQKEAELAGMRQVLDNRWRVLLHNQGERGVERRALTNELKPWRDAQKEKTAAEQRVEERRPLAEAALRDEAVALEQAVTLIRQPLADYKAEKDRQENRELRLRDLLTEWDRIAAKRTELINRAVRLKPLTEAARSQIHNEWTPHRARRDAITTEVTNLLQQTNPERRRAAHTRLMASLQDATTALTPYDCEEFPDAQNSLRTIRKRMDELRGTSSDTRTASVGPLGNVMLVAGFMVIPDLVLPPADRVPPAADRVPPVADRGPPVVAPAPAKEPEVRTGVPQDVLANTVRTEEWHYEECWYPRGMAGPFPPPGVAGPGAKVIELSVVIYHLKNGKAYYHRTEYDRKRQEMKDAGYNFAWSRQRVK